MAPFLGGSVEAISSALRGRRSHVAAIIATVRNGRGHRRGAYAALGTLAIVALAVLVWAGARSTGRDRRPSPVPADDPGVAHVHGLGINPADASLIVATHNGSFRIAEDDATAERIGDSFQDTMGFTVIGPDHFLGSGHPDVPAMRAGQPTQLGLIESTDAGKTWSILSLGGAADFHALAYAHDQVYGWDARTGRFMVSNDRRNWEARSTVDLYSFAVDPGDGDHIIGSGNDGSEHAGLIESVDGGRNWRALEGPDLIALSWDGVAGLWGADPRGTIWRHATSEWHPAGELHGTPQAFLATHNALYAAAHDAEDRTAIYRSTDSGRTWKVRYRDPAR